MRIAKLLTSLTLGLALAAGATAQSNTVAGVDIGLTRVKEMRSFGRMGTYPNGRTGAALLTTICNVGTVEITWRAPMNTKHPFSGFLFVRESNGRMEQISDRSFVKHGFAAANAVLCGSCSIPIGPINNTLGLGCSDTYTTNTNSDRFYLGPADEIDPWLGKWDRVCSHFDRGEPAVGAPNDCDTQRSLTSGQVAALDPVTHRIELEDADLVVPGASFYSQAHYVLATEAEALRGDNLGSRRVAVAWDGSEWTFAESGPLLLGSVLQRWTGASVTSATNGVDDGRVYVGVRVTGPVEGFYRYEYALHNRDNARGVGSLRIPLCAGARVRATGMRDIDGDPASDWSARVEGGEVVFETGANPLDWNTIYNFWFESDAVPVSGVLGLGAFAPGTGAPEFGVASTTPGGLFNLHLGRGCASGAAPSLYATGTPPSATLGNASFAVESAGNVPGSLNVLLLGAGGAPVARSGCALWIGAGARAVSTVRADATGLARHALPIPADPSLEGTELALQCSSRSVATGPKTARRILSDGLRVRVGSALSACP